MRDYDGWRTASVYAVLAIAVVLAATILWLVFPLPSLPTLPRTFAYPTDQHGALEDIRPMIVHSPICDDERPCS